MFFTSVIHASCQALIITSTTTILPFNHRRTTHKCVCLVMLVYLNFCSCDLDLDNDLDIQTWPRYCKDIHTYRNELYSSMLSQVRAWTQQTLDLYTGWATRGLGHKIEVAKWAGLAINILVYNTILHISIFLVSLSLSLQQAAVQSLECRLDSGPLAPLSNWKSGYSRSGQGG